MFVESILPGTEAECPVSEENSRRYPAKGKLASSTPKVNRRLINNLLRNVTGMRWKAILHSANITECVESEDRRPLENEVLVEKKDLENEDPLESEDLANEDPLENEDPPRKRSLKISSLWLL